VLEALGEVYYQDRVARERGLSRVERLHFHQQHNKPVMDDLHQWFEALLREQKVERQPSIAVKNWFLGHCMGLSLWGGFDRRTGIKDNAAGRGMR